MTVKVRNIYSKIGFLLYPVENGEDITEIDRIFSLFHFLPKTINLCASYRGQEPLFLHFLLLVRTRFLYWPTPLGFHEQLPCNLPIYPSLFINLHISTLKMEAVCSAETLVSALKNVCFHNPKDVMLIVCEWEWLWLCMCVYD
jgi:hypothetical protein